jgi:phosphoglycerate dehydrogenase-like enzyme
LLALDNVIVTPHVANTADMAVPELVGMVRRNVEHLAKDEPLEGLVDVSLGY